MTPQDRRILLFLAAAALLIALVPGRDYLTQRRDADVLSRLSPCTGAAHTGCLAWMPVTVAANTASSVPRGRALRIDAPAEARGRYVFADDAAVADLVAGTTVAAFIWHDRVVALGYADGQRSWTNRAPYQGRDLNLTVTVLLLLIASSLTTRALLPRAVALIDGQWRVRWRDWQSVVYNLQLFAATGTVFGLKEVFADAGDDSYPEPGPFVGITIFALIIGGAIAVNSAYQTSRERAATRAAMGSAGG